MEARPLRKMTVDEYVAFDRASEERFEYVNGEAFAMSGARPEHAVVVRNVIVALTTALRGKSCVALGEGQKIATPRTRAYHYPDASVVCGEPIRDDRDENAFVNPTVLVEVLSPTTADYDRGGKLVHYRTLEPFREYVLVDEASRSVEHHVRTGADSWSVSITRSGSIALVSIGVTLPLVELWLDVERVAAR